MNKYSLPAAMATLAFAALLPQTLLAQTPPPPPPPPEGAQPPPPPEASGVPAPAGAGRTLLLPDISLTGIQRGFLSTDRRDKNRERWRLDEAEFAIQGLVYPGIRLDNFAVFAEGEATIEESYLTVENLHFGRLPLSAVVGRRKVPIGRVNQLHPHSWLYSVPPAVLRNLVASESLTGDGAYVSYLVPTGRLFTQLDAGFWSLSEPAGQIAPPGDTSREILASPGAGFADRFYTLRLQSATAFLGGDIEASGAVAGGRGLEYAPGGDGTPTVRPHLLLSNLGLTYRRAGRGSARWLLRAEYYAHQQRDGGFRQRTDGHYLFADHRLDPYTSLALRYDRSGFPYAPGRHEQSVSLIGTHQLTEATYLRGQWIQGSRPGRRSVSEVHLEIVFGIGPHTHNLE